MRCSTSAKGVSQLTLSNNDMDAVIYFRDGNAIGCGWNVQGEYRAWALTQIVLPRGIPELKPAERITAAELETKILGLLRAVSYR